MCGEVEGWLSLGPSLGSRHLPPRGKGPVPEQSVMEGSHQVASNPKEIVNGAVDGEEALNVACGFKAPHVAFALAGGLMGDFSAVVGVLISTVMDGGEGGPVGRGITAQLVGDQAVGHVL